MYLNTVSGNTDKDPFNLSVPKDDNAALYDSSALFGDRRQIMISHNGAIYRLKITRFGKLILNK